MANLIVILVICIVSSGRSAPASAPTRFVAPRPAAPNPDSSQGPSARNLTAVLEKLEQWRSAVEQHNPGQFDDAAKKIAGWSYPEVQSVIGTIKEATKTLSDSPARAVGSLPQRWLGLTGDEARRGDASRILKRGALLHTDIALLGPEGPPVEPAYSGPRQIRVNDGRALGQTHGMQWEFARKLLDLIQPQPSSDAMVRQWYVATTSLMQYMLQWGSAKLNLERAYEIFPADAGVLFLSGALHESFSMPFAQNALPPPGTHFDIGSAESELRLAKLLYQRAIESDAFFPEAHLRLGRVQGRMGDHEGAIVELRQADSALTEPLLQYFVALFLGQEYEMSGTLDAAREHFEHASKLCPVAQSPLLALSEIARRTGNTPGALAALEIALTLRRIEDPWWNYSVSHVRRAYALMEEMRKVFGGLPR